MWRFFFFCFFPIFIWASQVDELLQAVGRGDSQHARDLIDSDHGSIFWERDSFGRVPTVSAIERGRHDIAQRLIDHGAPVDVVYNGQSLLTLVMVHDESAGPLFEKLLENYANPDLVLEDGNRALHVAAFEGNISAIKKLLSAGADPNAENNDNETPLDIYITSLCDSEATLNQELVKELISFGSKPTRYMNMLERRFNAALFTEGDRLRAVLQLFKRYDSSKPRIKKSFCSQVFEALGEKDMRTFENLAEMCGSRIFSLVDDDGDPPLLWALKKRNGEAQRLILEKEEVLYKRNAYGEALLPWIIRHAGDDNFLDWLLSRGIVQVDAHLKLVADSKNVAIIRYLLNREELRSFPHVVKPLFEQAAYMMKNGEYVATVLLPLSTSMHAYAASIPSGSGWLYSLIQTIELALQNIVNEDGHESIGYKRYSHDLKTIRRIFRGDHHKAKKRLSYDTKKASDKVKEDAGRKNDLCAICRDSFDDEEGASFFRVSCCASQFHPECLRNQIKYAPKSIYNRCPKCRINFTCDDIKALSIKDVVQARERESSQTSEQILEDEGFARWLAWDR